MRGPKIILGIPDELGSKGIGVNVEGDSHLMGIVFNGDGLGSILGDLAATFVFLVEESAISSVVTAHEGGEAFQVFEGIDLMGMIAHKAEGVEGIGLFEQLLVEHLQIGPFFVCGADIPFPVMASPDFMEGEAGFEEEASGESRHKHA